ncbi:MAG TPA: protein tyrosine phosphatase family protein [Caulobacterales bacterium]|nr:protein tyrosine phosphatase family protein [Caulobacterales bacterium]
MSLTAIKAFVPLADDIGTSGQPTREQFAGIAAAGYDAVVNLALPTSDNAIPDEGALVTGLGMAYFHVPVIFESPTQDDLRLFLGVMHSLEGRKKWVHCAANLRVSAFCYHYLRGVRGLDEAAARSPVLEQWAPTMSDAWKNFLTLV